MPTITLTPLIDTVLVLLVMFMITGPGKTPVVPDTSKNYQAVVLHIGQTGALSLDGKAVKDAQLTSEAVKRFETLPLKVVRICADPLAPLPLVHKVIDTMRYIDGVRIVFW